MIFPSTAPFRSAKFGAFGEMNSRKKVIRCSLDENAGGRTGRGWHMLSLKLYMYLLYLAV
jgi:hypothetical protein